MGKAKRFVGEKDGPSVEGHLVMESLALETSLLRSVSRRSRFHRGAPHDRKGGNQDRASPGVPDEVVRISDLKEFQRNEDSDDAESA